MRVSSDQSVLDDQKDPTKKPLEKAVYHCDGLRPSCRRVYPVGRWVSDLLLMFAGRKKNETLNGYLPN